MIVIPKVFLDSMISHALADDPNECCGILAGSNGIFHKLFRMTNVDSSPYRYSWDSKELFHVWREMEDSEWDFRLVYHSHTHSPAYPSDTDIRLANWPEASYLILSLENKDLPIVRCFDIIDGVVTEKDIEIK